MPWRFDSGDRAFGIFVDAELCWVGDDDGRITALDHDGQVVRRMKVPEAVMSLVRDGDWLYCGCEDGKVYDLSGAQPFEAYEISEDLRILWLDIHDGSLAVTGDDGTVTVLDHDCDKLWVKKSGSGGGWMVRCDDAGIYHGHADGVTAYDWAGKKRWARKTAGSVLFGWQEDTEVYAATAGDAVQVFTKAGEPGKTYACDDTVFSCAAAPGGKYVFAADNCSSVYCFDRAGNRLWKLDTTCGSVLSMQFFRDRLYLVTNEGALACLDVSEPAIARAREGKLARTCGGRPLIADRPRARGQAA